MTDVGESRHDPYAALRHRDFRLYFSARILLVLAGEATNVAVGWLLYERTHSAFALGLIGLSAGLPVILLALPGGHVADSFDRRRVSAVTGVLIAISAAVLASLSYWQAPVPFIYLTLLLGGVVVAFNYPARAALLPQIVPREHFANAATWSSTAFLASAAIGPAFAGILIARTHSTTGVFAADAALTLLYAVLVANIQGHQPEPSGEKMTLRSLAAGFEYVRKTEVILAAITLDLFAVLLGGATTLLPVFAKDILHVGADGLGWLRAAPSMGALLMAVVIAHLAPMRRSGRKLYFAVAGFGVATIVFGLSKSFALSLVMLFSLGALDAVSMVIRSTLVQVRTPDEMRGRVSAVNGMFVDTSNEFGGFESGAVAALIGPVASVVAGGIGTLLSVVVVMQKWPALAKLDSLHAEDLGNSGEKEA